MSKPVKTVYSKCIFCILEMIFMSCESKGIYVSRTKLQLRTDSCLVFGCQSLSIFEHNIYSALRKYSAPLNFVTFCHISGFKHKDIKLYFFVKSQQVGHNHEVERHLLDISNFFNKSKTEKLGVQNYSAPLLSVQQTLSRSSVRISE